MRARERERARHYWYPARCPRHACAGPVRVHTGAMTRVRGPAMRGPGRWAPRRFAALARQFGPRRKDPSWARLARVLGLCESPRRWPLGEDEVDCV